MEEQGMDKNKFAVTPPMGWNSYDYYDTTVNEDQVKANADYMAKHLKEFGWQYIVIDIEWFAHGAGSQRDVYQIGRASCREIFCLYVYIKVVAV